ncbi:MAG: hypothetical protein RRC34_06305 [Lentisphaeria bacterium]|nr:hypothetical protein [Lentisphaeria bacterium]
MNFPTNNSDVSKSSAPPRLHRQTLVEVNISVHTGRRNAAHEQAAAVLHASTEQTRMDTKRELAQFGKELIDEALLCTRRSLVEVDAPPLRYLQILRDTIAAQESLIAHEIELTNGNGELAALLGDKLARQLAAFNAVETSNVNYIEELFTFGIPLLDRDTKERLAAFSEDDRRRYQIAVEEFKRCYARRKNEILAS